MKKMKSVLVILALILMTVMLSGCLAIEMKINANGSCDMTYTIDMSQVEGMMTKAQLEESIKESVEEMNDDAGKDIAKLKSVKENKKEKTMTAIISISDISKMGDGTFYGTVKQYLKDDGTGLDQMVKPGKSKVVDEDDIPLNLHMVYLPMSGSEEFGVVEVTVIVPGTIQYVTKGAKVDDKTAVFTTSTPLIVFKKGGGLPVIPILLVILVVVVLLVISGKKKKSASAVAPFSPMPIYQAPAQAPMAPVVQVVEQPVMQTPVEQIPIEHVVLAEDTVQDQTPEA